MNLAGEDLEPNTSVVVIGDIVFKQNPDAPSVVTCDCGEPSDHQLGHVREFVCVKSLVEVWVLRGSCQHKLVYMRQ